MEKELRELCLKVKQEVEEGAYEAAYQDITEAMKDKPDSGVPHNLMGILEERKSHHAKAMKHFRAAWALEPTLLPARWNLDVYGSGSRTGICAYLEEDVPQEAEKPKFKWVYDEKGIGHMVRREKS